MDNFIIVPAGAQAPSGIKSSAGTDLRCVLQSVPGYEQYIYGSDNIIQNG